MFFDDTDFLNEIKKNILHNNENFYFEFDNLSYSNSNNRKMFITALSLFDEITLSHNNKHLIFSGKINENAFKNIDEDTKKRIKGTIWKYETEKFLDKKQITINDEEIEKHFHSSLPSSKNSKMQIAFDNIKYLLEISCKYEKNETCDLITISSSQELILNKIAINILSMSILDFDIVSIYSSFNNNDLDDDDVKGFRFILGYSKEKIIK